MMSRKTGKKLFRDEFCDHDLTLVYNEIYFVQMACLLINVTAYSVN